MDIKLHKTSEELPILGHRVVGIWGGIGGSTFPGIQRIDVVTWYGEEGDRGRWLGPFGYNAPGPDYWHEIIMPPEV